MDHTELALDQAIPGKNEEMLDAEEQKPKDEAKEKSSEMCQRQDSGNTVPVMKQETMQRIASSKDVLDQSLQTDSKVTIFKPKELTDRSQQTEASGSVQGSATSLRKLSHGSSPELPGQESRCGSQHSVGQPVLSQRSSRAHSEQTFLPEETGAEPPAAQPWACQSEPVEGQESRRGSQQLETPEPQCPGRQLVGAQAQALNKEDTAEEPAWFNERIGAYMASSGQQTSIVWGPESLAEILLPFHEAAITRDSGKETLTAEAAIVSSGDAEKEQPALRESQHSMQRPEGRESRRASQMPREAESRHSLQPEGRESRRASQTPREEESRHSLQPEGRESRRASQTPIEEESRHSVQPVERQESKSVLQQSSQQLETKKARSEEQQRKPQRKAHKNKVDQAQQTDSAQSLKKELFERGLQTDTTSSAEINTALAPQDSHTGDPQLGLQKNGQDSLPVQSQEPSSGGQPLKESEICSGRSPDQLPDFCDGNRGQEVYHGSLPMHLQESQQCELQEFHRSSLPLELQNSHRDSEQIDFQQHHRGSLLAQLGESEDGGQPPEEKYCQSSLSPELQECHRHDQKTMGEGPGQSSQEALRVEDKVGDESELQGPTPSEKKPSELKQKASFSQQTCSIISFAETTWLNRRTGRLMKDKSQQTNDSWLQNYREKTQKLTSKEILSRIGKPEDEESTCPEYEKEAKKWQPTGYDSRRGSQQAAQAQSRRGSEEPAIPVSQQGSGHLPISKSRKGSKQDTVSESQRGNEPPAPSAPLKGSEEALTSEPQAGSELPPMPRSQRGSEQAATPESRRASEPPARSSESLNAPGSRRASGPPNVPEFWKGSGHPLVPDSRKGSEQPLGSESRKGSECPLMSDSRKGSEQPLVPESRKGSEPPLMSDSRKGSEQPLMSESRKGSEHPLVPESRKGSEHPLVPESRKGSTQPLVPESRKGSEHPLVPESRKGSEQPLVPESRKGSEPPLMSESRKGSEQPLVPESRKGSEHPLVPESRKGSEHPLVPESRKGSTQPLVPESRKGSEQPLVPESRKGSTQPLVPESRKGSEHPLVPESRKGSEHPLVPESRKGSEHPLVPESRKGSTQPLVPESRKSSEHPLVPESRKGSGVSVHQVSERSIEWTADAESQRDSQLPAVPESQRVSETPESRKGSKHPVMFESRRGSGGSVPPTSRRGSEQPASPKDSTVPVPPESRRGSEPLDSESETEIPSRLPSETDQSKQKPSFSAKAQQTYSIISVEINTWINRRSGKLMRCSSQQTDKSWLQDYIARKVKLASKGSLVSSAAPEPEKPATLESDRRNIGDLLTSRDELLAEGCPGGSELLHDHGPEPPEGEAQRFLEQECEVVSQEEEPQPQRGGEKGGLAESAVLDQGSQPSEAQESRQGAQQAEGQASRRNSQKVEVQGTQQGSKPGAEQDARRGSQSSVGEAFLFSNTLWNALASPRQPPTESESKGTLESLSSIYAEGEEEALQTYSIISLENGIWLNRKTGKLLVSRSQQTSVSTMPGAGETAPEECRGAAERQKLPASEVEQPEGRPSSWPGQNQVSGLSIVQTLEELPSADEPEKGFSPHKSEATLLSIESSVAYVEEEYESFPVYSVISISEESWINVKTGKTLATQCQQTDESSSPQPEKEAQVVRRSSYSPELSHYDLRDSSVSECSQPTWRSDEPYEEPEMPDG
ncbi:hypothetical protein EYD10_03056 [Varanus komodoensis]|nr:hypothetical protein EYD10_03056 [Varanus komodoensis]